MPPLETPETTEGVDYLPETRDLGAGELLILVGRWQVRTDALDFQMFQRLQRAHQARNLIQQETTPPHSGVHREMHLEAFSGALRKLVEMFRFRHGREARRPVASDDLLALVRPCGAEQVYRRRHSGGADPAGLSHIRHPEECEIFHLQRLGDFLQAVAVGTGLDDHHQLTTARFTRHLKVSPQCHEINFSPSSRRRHRKRIVHAPKGNLLRQTGKNRMANHSALARNLDTGLLPGDAILVLRLASDDDIHGGRPTARCGFPAHDLGSGRLAGWQVHGL